MKSPTDAIAAEQQADHPLRQRILNAAFAAFMEHGYAGASTLDIATRAKVSKRELYSHFPSKEALFAAGVGARTRRMQLLLQFPDVTTHEALSKTLNDAGKAVLTSVTEPGVLAVYRLAISESARTPKLAVTLDKAGRQENRRAIAELIVSAQRHKLIKPGEPDEMAEQFFALLWTDLLPRLILRVVQRPVAGEIARRATRAVEAFLALNSTRDGA